LESFKPNYGVKFARQGMKVKQFKKYSENPQLLMKLNKLNPSVGSLLPAAGEEKKIIRQMSPEAK
jgi:hypothetical protein